MSKIVPAWQDVARETIIVIGGAVVAAVIVGNWPTLRDWIKRQWGYDAGDAKPW